MRLTKLQMLLTLILEKLTTLKMMVKMVQMRLLKIHLQIQMSQMQMSFGILQRKNSPVRAEVV